MPVPLSELGAGSFVNAVTSTIATANVCTTTYTTFRLSHLFLQNLLQIQVAKLSRKR